jgi:hypothetical protein
VNLNTAYIPHLGRRITFGRKRPGVEALAKVPKFGKYLIAKCSVCGGNTLPTPPSTVDYSLAALPCLSQIMGNDQYGDCTCAGAGHELGLWTGNAGTLVTLTTAQVLALYSAITGFDPNVPGSDQGADEVTVLNYLMASGFPDGSKLAGYVAIDGTNKQECMLASWLFGSLYLGLELPDAWLSPMPSANGFVWNVGTPNPGNGHCVVSIGHTPTQLNIDTWALLGGITWEAIATLTVPDAGGQLYALLSPDWVSNVTAKAPSGFDFATLQGDLSALAAAGRGGLTA